MFYSLLEQILIMLPLILGAYLTICLLKLPDFSIESAYLFGAVIGYLCREQAFPVIILSAMLGGMLVGTVVCFLNRVLKLPFLLSAIVTNGLFHGLTQYYLGASYQSFQVTFPFSEIYMLMGLGLFLTVIVRQILRSQLGFCMAIFGNNPNFFNHHQISSGYVMFFALLMGHGLAGISGLLFAQSNGFVDLSMNFGVVLLCLAALTVGKLMVRTHIPEVLLPILGITSYFLMQQTLLKIGFNLKYFNAFQAIFLMAILIYGHRMKKFTVNQLGV